MFKGKRIISWLLLATLLGLSVWLGCSRMAPTAPAAAAAAATEAGLIKDLSLIKIINDLDIVITEETSPLVSKTIGFLGGTLSIPLGDDTSSFNVSPGALGLNVLIQALAVQGKASDGRTVTTYDFLPDGLRFLKPAKLVHYAENPDAKLLLYWFNPLTLNWEIQQTVQTQGRKAEFAIRHFSKYAVVDGSTSASGQ